MRFVMTDVAHIHLFTFDARRPGIAVAKFIDGEGDDIGKAEN